MIRIMKLQLRLKEQDNKVHTLYQVGMNKSLRFLLAIYHNMKDCEYIL